VRRKQKIVAVAWEGDEIRIKVINKKRPDEWSIYRIKIDKNAYKGDGLDDIMLDETTGYEEDA